MYYQRLQTELDDRAQTGTLRSLIAHNNNNDNKDDDVKNVPVEEEEEEDGPNVKNHRHHHGKNRNITDFSSNDYLGLSRSITQIRIVTRSYEQYVASALQSRYSSNSNSNQSHSDDGGDNIEEGEYVKTPILGATGSRLLSGDSALASQLENTLAKIHNRPAALLFNSGYDANISILSCLPIFDRGDVIVMDELSHNSLQMGWRLARGATSLNSSDNQKRIHSIRTFRHNCVDDLKQVLMECYSDDNGYPVKSSDVNLTNKNKMIFIVVESVYSMEGDVAPLKEMLDMASTFGACVIVDEAHGLGVYGKTNVNDLRVSDFERDAKVSNIGIKGSIRTDIGGTGVLAAMGVERHSSLLCSVHTFGKAAGCHGAVVACNNSMLKQYFINYARPFIYSTSMSPHSLICIQRAYDYFGSIKADMDRTKLFNLVRYFRSVYMEQLQMLIQHNSKAGNKPMQFRAERKPDLFLLPSPSPIQSIVICGNTRCKNVSWAMRGKGFDVYPIRAPTVSPGQERIRVVLHVYNTKLDIKRFVEALMTYLINEQTPRLHSRL